VRRAASPAHCSVGDLLAIYVGKMRNLQLLARTERNSCAIDSSRAWRRWLLSPGRGRHARHSLGDAGVRGRTRPLPLPFRIAFVASSRVIIRSVAPPGHQPTRFAQSDGTGSRLDSASRHRTWRPDSRTRRYHCVTRGSRCCAHRAAKGLKSSDLPPARAESCHQPTGPSLISTLSKHSRTDRPSSRRPSVQDRG